MAKQALPRAITVGPYQYRVILKSARELKRDGKELLGYCDNDNLEIAVLRSLRIAKKREVLLHETLHACHYNAGRNPEDKLTGEHFVEATVHSLLQIMRDNPEWLAYIID